MAAGSPWTAPQGDMVSAAEPGVPARSPGCPRVLRQPGPGKRPERVGVAVVPDDSTSSPVPGGMLMVCSSSPSPVGRSRPGRPPGEGGPARSHLPPSGPRSSPRGAHERAPVCPGPFHIPPFAGSVFSASRSRWPVSTRLGRLVPGRLVPGRLVSGRLLGVPVDRYDLVEAAHLHHVFNLAGTATTWRSFCSPARGPWLRAVSP